MTVTTASPVGPSLDKAEALARLCVLRPLPDPVLKDVDAALTDCLRQAVARVRAAVALRLCDCDWAPVEAVRLLAFDEIEIARPVLERSRRLAEDDLDALARLDVQLRDRSGHRGVDVRFLELLAGLAQASFRVLHLKLGGLVLGFGDLVVGARGLELLLAGEFLGAHLAHAVERRLENSPHDLYRHIHGDRRLRTGVTAIMGPGPGLSGRLETTGSLGSLAYITQCSYRHLAEVLRGGPPDPPVLLLQGLLRRGPDPADDAPPPDSTGGVLLPVYQFDGIPDLTGEPQAETDGQYAILLRDGEGAEIARYTFEPAWRIPDIGLERGVAGFAYRVPDHPDVHQVQLIGPLGALLDEVVVVLKLEGDGVELPVLLVKRRAEPTEMRPASGTDSIRGLGLVVEDDEQSAGHGLPGVHEHLRVEDGGDLAAEVHDPLDVLVRVRDARDGVALDDLLDLLDAQVAAVCHLFQERLVRLVDEALQ